MVEEIPVKLPETSLERGMREIRETASKLDRNLPMFRQDVRSAEESQVLNF
jgi:hypothetical protein